MIWKELLQANDPNPTLVAPWLGGRSLHQGPRAWRITGRLPPEVGWYTFGLLGRRATVLDPSPPAPDGLTRRAVGYLVGDRFVPDGARVPVDLAEVVRQTERVHLVAPGVDRFARISAGRTHSAGPLIFQEEEMPLGPEESVLEALLDGKPSLDGIKEVTPALDTAFRMEVWRKLQVARRRAELEERRRREEQRRRMAELRDHLGDGEARRQMARIDFEAAARAALEVSGAEYRDHRPSAALGEMVVRFRLDGRRYECVCDAHTLRITDAGICLIDHVSGEKGDDRFTLESLPGVIRQAEREGALVVFRHQD